MSQALALWITAGSILAIGILCLWSAVKSNGRVPRRIKNGQYAVVPLSIAVASWIVGQIQPLARATQLEVAMALVSVVGTMFFRTAILAYTRVWSHR